MVIFLGIVKPAVHSRIQADDHAFELFRPDARPFTGVFKVFRTDKPPASDPDLEAYRLARIGIHWHFMCITRPPSVEFA